MVVATETRQRGLMHRKIVDLPVLMEHFEIHNRTEGKSPRTVEWYNLVPGQLCDCLGAVILPTPESGIQDIPKGIAQQVDRKHDQRNSDTWEDR